MKKTLLCTVALGLFSFVGHTVSAFDDIDKLNEKQKSIMLEYKEAEVLKGYSMKGQNHLKPFVAITPSQVNSFNQKSDLKIERINEKVTKQTLLKAFKTEIKNNKPLIENAINNLKEPIQRADYFELVHYVENYWKKGLNEVDLPNYEGVHYFKKQEEKNYDKYTINHLNEAYAIFDEIYDKLPNEVYLFHNKSYYVKPDDIVSVYYQWLSDNKHQNNHTLASYRLIKTKDYVKLIDNSHKLHGGREIKASVDSFAQSFAEQIKGFSQEEQLEIVYDYIYENFDYNANGFQQMMVGNMDSGTFACNGYSHLFNDIMNQLNGFESKVVMGESHFWNELKLSNGKVIVVDITTDKLIKKKYYTLGQTREIHEKAINMMEHKFYNVAHKDLKSLNYDQCQIKDKIKSLD